MKKSRLLGAVCASALSFGLTTSADAALIGRLETSTGSGVFQAYYDDQLDITWAANANINGYNDWYNQVAWVAGLTIDGVGGWQLPNMDKNGDGTIVDCSSVTQAACMDNEYGHLFNYGAGTILGGGISASRPGSFSNVQSGDYMSTEVASDPARFWYFGFSLGDWGAGNKNGSGYAWAIHDGDVGAVPVPAAVWLFGSGLLGLVGIARKKRATS